MTEHIPFKVAGIAADLPAVQLAMQTLNRPSFRAQLYLTLLRGVQEAGLTSTQLEDVDKLFKPKPPSITIKTPQYYREQMLNFCGIRSAVKDTTCGWYSDRVVGYDRTVFVNANFLLRNDIPSQERVKIVAVYFIVTVIHALHHYTCNRLKKLYPVDGGDTINTKRESGESAQLGLLGDGLTLFYYGEDAEIHLRHVNINRTCLQIRGIGIRRLDGQEYLAKPDFIDFVLSGDKFPSAFEEDKLLDFFYPIESQFRGELGVIRSCCPICALDGSGDLKIARDSPEWGKIGYIALERPSDKIQYYGLD
ncbi:hypothetical protein HK104_010860 [Borealophlyctis nickersoniae]|nr:hypothetical protein HK104_010860 [Borealophlyctis nickersoniae]